MDVIQKVKSEIPPKVRSFLNVMVLTAVGSFVGALAHGQIPMTWDGWRSILPGAISAALAAEVILLHTVFAPILQKISTGGLPALLALLESSNSPVTGSATLVSSDPQLAPTPTQQASTTGTTGSPAPVAAVPSPLPAVEKPSQEKKTS